MRYDVEMKIPIGDKSCRRRYPSCEYIDYDNPRIITGDILCIGRLLLCTSNNRIHLDLGILDIACRFLETKNHSEGALRETLEKKRINTQSVKQASA